MANNYDFDESVRRKATLLCLIIEEISAVNNIIITEMEKAEK